MWRLPSMTIQAPTCAVRSGGSFIFLRRKSFHWVPRAAPMITDNRAGCVLVAGLGNIFFGDDAFGVEVARRLAKQRLPEHVRVLDAGIRTMHLAYEMVEHTYDTVILVD